nr:MAG TPA: hypothetical protein [Caudoviricetes sp.]
MGATFVTPTVRLVRKPAISPFGALKSHINSLKTLCSFFQMQI